MKVVIDCNVIISAGLTDGKCREVMKIVLAHYSNYISDEIVREFRDVIQRKKFAIYKSSLINLFESVCLTSVWIKELTSNNEFELPDIDDQKYLDLALSVSANYLITGNIKDFPLKNYNSLIAITPHEFLNLPEIKTIN